MDSFTQAHEYAEHSLFNGPFQDNEDDYWGNEPIDQQFPLLVNERRLPPRADYSDSYMRRDQYAHTQTPQGFVDQLTRFRGNCRLYNHQSAKR
jgi:hypothetical protein